MDWNRLLHFALLGSSDWEQYAILLVRVSMGLFFAISGQTNCLSPAERNLFTTLSAGIIRLIQLSIADFRHAATANFHASVLIRRIAFPLQGFHPMYVSHDCVYGWKRSISVDDSLAIVVGRAMLWS
jgi:hypothetical protein